MIHSQHMSPEDETFKKLKQVPFDDVHNEALMQGGIDSITHKEYIESCGWDIIEYKRAVLTYYYG